MTDCVFCDIVAGRAEARIVRRDDDTVAFLDLRQPHVGHVLVVPCRHVETIFDLPSDIGAALIDAVRDVARAVRDAFGPDGLSLWQSNGPGAFQEVPHVHVHVMPRFAGDGLLRIYPERLGPPDHDALHDMAARIRAAT